MVMLITPGLAFIAAALGLAPAEDAKPDGKRIQKIVIVHQDGSEKTVDVGEATARAMAMVDCGDAKNRFESSDEDKDGDTVRKQKIVICNIGQGDQLAALEKARDRLAKGEDFGVDPRAKALAALDAEIARLKAAK